MRQRHQDRRRTRAEGMALVAAWHGRKSDQKLSEFCRHQGVRPWALRYWLGRESVYGPRGFVEITAPKPSLPLEVAVGGALVRVRPGFDPGLLRAVVDALVAVEGALC